MSAKRQVEDERREERFGKESKSEKAQTPRLRAPVGTPGETGVGRPDGRKPEAGGGAGPGSGGVTGNPVARGVKERHLNEIAVLGSKRCGCDIQEPGVTP